MLNEKLHSRFNKDGLIQVICDEDRSQYINKQKAVDRLMNLLINALHKPKIRKLKGISKAAKAKRLSNKRINAEKKESRRDKFDE